MANKLKPATKADGGKVIKALLKEGISKVEDTFGISNMAIQNVVYTNSTYYPECSVGCVLIEAHGEVVEDIIDIMKKLGYRYAEDFGDGIVLVFAPKGVSDSDIEDALNGKINESTDVSVKEIVRSKIIKYAQDRLNKSGAVLLAPVYDMINFNDPLDGMISFDYLNTIAENEELSEEESGYDYIEQAVTDIANFIQNQGFILDEESDDPLIFIDENYDYEDDEELEDMNEAASIKKSDRYKEFNLLPKGKGWMDPVELTNKDAGFYAIAGTIYDKSDRDNEDEWSIVVILAPLDENYEDVVITGSFYDYEEAADGIMNRLSRAKTPSDVARIIKDQEFYDDYDDDESEFLSALTKSFKAQNESTMMNEAVHVTKPKPNEAKSHYISKEGSTMIQNKQLGFYAIIGDYYDEDEPEFEGDISAYISTLGTSTVSIDDKKINEVLETIFYNRNKANTMMKELSDVDNLTDLAKILRKYEFYNSDMDTTKGQREFISILESKISNINESTVMNESAQIRPCDPALEGFDLLGSNNPFDFEPVDLENEELGFYAIAGVATGANPGAAWVEDDCSIEICITALDPDYTDEVLVAEYYDVDYKAMSVMKELASATSYNKLTSILVKEGFQGMNSGPFDFVDDLEAINSMNEATEVPDGRMTVELDDTDVVEGDTLLLAELTDDVFNAVNTVLDELDPDADVEITIDNEDLLQLAVVSDEDLDDDAFDQVLSELLEDMDLEDIVADMTDSEPIEDPDDEDFGRVIQYINFYPATGATVVPDNSVMEDNVDVIEDEDAINESFKLNTDLTKFVDKLADSFFGSIKDANFLNLEDEDGNLYFQVSTGDKSYSRKLLTNFLAFLAKKNVDFDLVNKVNVTGNSTFWNATVIVKINNKQGSQVQYRNELNESTDVSNRRISHYVDDLNFKSGVKFLDGDDKIEKVLKAINPKADIRFYGLDKLPWTTYKIDGRDYVAVFSISGRLFTPMAISITDGKNISDFINNSKSILTFTNKKLQDWNNVVIPVRIMNNLAKVTDRASEYKAIKSLLTKYEKQVYNYEQFDESVDPIYESYYKDTDEDLSIDQAKITKALKAISRILTKEGYPLDNLDKVYRFNYPRPGLVEINLINTLKSTYGRISDKAYDIDSKIEKKLESLNLTYASKDKYGKEIYTDDDKLVHYDGKDISKYIQTGKVPDREFRNNRVDAVNPKLEDIAKGITEYLTSHPTYKKYNTYGYKPVNVGADYISIKVEVANVEYGKEILSDTDKYIKKNYKDLYPIIRSNPPDKKYPYIYYSLLDTGRPLGHLMKSEYEMRGSSIKKLMNESVDDDNSESIASYDYSESAKSPKLPTQSELKTIIQKSMIKFGERNTQVTVHAYRTSKYESGVVEVDLDGTSLATDGREEDYYDEDNIKNALEYASKELVDKFGQDKDLLDYIDVQYNKVGSLTITFSLDSELNEATKFDFNNLEEVLEEDLESDIDLPDYADNIIVNSYATGYGYGVKATFDDRLVKDNKLRIISRIVKTIADRCGKDYDLDHHHDKMRGEYSLTLNYKGSPINESANYKKLADKLESSVDNIDDSIVINVDQNDYGYDIIATFDNSLLGSNPNKIIDKIVDSIVKRNGKYSDLVHYNNKVTGEYKVILSYKGQLNECAIIGPDETDIDSLRANELSRALSSEQPLVDPYDIRCTIRPVFVRKDQFLFDGSTVYKATANASTDKDSGTTEIKVDVLLSNDPDISDASMTLTLPTEFDGLKLLRGNPTKVYNESADVKADTVTLSFANEDEANEFIKDNGVKPEKSFEGKFGWTVILKKSDLKKIK